MNYGKFPEGIAEDDGSPGKNGIEDLLRQWLVFPSNSGQQKQEDSLSGGATKVE